MKDIRSTPSLRILGLLCLLCFYCCKDQKSTTTVEAQSVEMQIETQPLVTNTIETRFAPPSGFERDVVQPGSFAEYLRTFALLDAQEKVHLFDGSLKSNQNIHAAILDIDVGNKDLQQCADAIMRLQAEYLWKEKKYNAISFNFTNGWRFDYSVWRKGMNLHVDRNRTYWVEGNGPKETYGDFRAYLDRVFMYAGTYSLAKELDPKKLKDVEIGDVFIIGGSPGHAIIVVDVAYNHTNGDKALLLAQSYMPAQQIHILRNLNRPASDPWYLLSDINPELYTPEWTFMQTDLKSFEGINF